MPRPRPFAVAAMMVAAAGLAVAACARAPTGFSASNAERHVRRLAGVIGSRPAGTVPNRQAREFLVETLRGAGFEVRVQQADAQRSGLGVTARVSNIIAIAPGARPEAVALMAHYDSVPDGPGAADDAFGAAVCVEAGRALAARQSRPHSVAVILTDGEELGLMGAAALLRDPVRDRIRLVLNFEAIGSGGPVMLFETGPSSDALVAAWAQAAPRPAGASFMPEIYGAISRGGDRTDLGLLRRAGVPGLDFAAVGDGYTYHTPIDTPARLDHAALAQAGDNAVATVDAFERRGSGAAQQASTYFDLLRWTAVRYGHRGELAVFGLAILVGLVAWFHVAATAMRSAGLSRLLLTVPLLLGLLAATAGGMVAAVWLLRLTRDTLHPWYAHPGRFFACLVAWGTAAGWALLRVGRLLPSRLRGSTQPAAVWVITLPIWILLTVLAGRYASASAFLIAWPTLLAAVALLALPVERPTGMRAANVVVTIVAWAMWGPDLVLLLRFAVTELGRTPIVTPLVLYPATLLAAGLVVAPPILALVAGDGRTRGAASAGGGWQTGAALLLLAVGTFVACWLSPAYTPDRPRYRSVRYVADVGRAEAAWEIGANEPTPVLGRTWQEGAVSPVLSAAVGVMPAPFLQHAPAPAPGALPFRVTGSVLRGREASLEIRAVPVTPGWTIAFALPPDVIPLETNLAVSMRHGRQVAVFQAVPPEGITFRGRFESSDTSKLPLTTVIATGPGLPGADWPSLPAWLPHAIDVWRARSYYLLPVEWTP